MYSTKIPTAPTDASLRKSFDEKVAFVSRADQESRDAQLACKKSFPSSVSNVLAMRRVLVLIAAFIGICSGLRCWVDHQATESVDCGPHSGCIKVAEKNITNLGTKSWYGTQPKFENQSKSFIFKFSLQVWQSHHSSY